MPAYNVVAVRHHTRHNDQRCAAYWAIVGPDGDHSPSHIYTHWFCRKTPKRILSVLESAPEDPEDFGDKRGNFILELKEPLVFRDFGQVKFENVISITPHH